jgi:Tat protein translocase TatB subunit
VSSVGPSELFLLFIIGVLILGPERLPRVASQIGRWVGRARRTANQLRYQLEREIAESERQQAPTARPARRDNPATGKIGGEPPAAADASGNPVTEPATSTTPTTPAAGEADRQNGTPPG